MFTKWKPAVFQGSLKNKNYFEGWYFKAVDKPEKNAIAVIVGISLNQKDTSHAFIMVLEARKQKLHYFSYPVDKFKYNKDQFQLQIEDNYFSLKEMRLNLKGKTTIKAHFVFQNIIPWPVNYLSPGVMGWYSFIPFLECYHGVLSLNHRINGNMAINGILIDFNEAKGYIEKDWGKSMPSSWIWMQTNHFKEDHVSFFGSIAHIPWMKNYFTGYIFGLLIENKLYQFTTYNGAKIEKLSLNEHHIKIELHRKEYKLFIEANRTDGLDLPAPSMGEMINRVNESLKSGISVKLIQSDVILYSGEGRNAGLEFVGEISELLDGLKK